jgi:hypothetical protein
MSEQLPMRLPFEPGESMGDYINRCCRLLSGLNAADMEFQVQIGCRLCGGACIDKSGPEPKPLPGSIIADYTFCGHRFPLCSDCAAAAEQLGLPCPECNRGRTASEIVGRFHAE